MILKYRLCVLSEDDENAILDELEALGLAAKSIESQSAHIELAVGLDDLPRMAKAMTWLTDHGFIAPVVTKWNHLERVHRFE